MTKEELKTILDLHKKWLNKEGGVKANLSYANLRYADLSSADLSSVDLSSANLSYANLSSANLSYANLSYANLRYADLSSANLSSVDLSGANLDFSCLPLSCRGLNFKIDEKLAKQLVYHVINLMQYSEIPTITIFNEELYKWLEDSHLVIEHGLPKIRGAK